MLEGGQRGLILAGLALCMGEPVLSEPWGPNTASDAGAHPSLLGFLKHT